MPEKKSTEVVVVGVAPNVAEEVRATQAEDKKAAEVIAETTAIVAEDLKTKDDEREAKADAREDAKDAKEEVKEAKAAKAARFALVVDLAKALIIGLPIIITAYGVARQSVKLDAQEVKLTSIHGWVNSGMRNQLEEKHQIAAELAMLTMLPKHIETARLYKEQLAEHDRQQAKQDAKSK